MYHNIYKSHNIKYSFRVHPIYNEYFTCYKGLKLDESYSCLAKQGEYKLLELFTPFKDILIATVKDEFGYIYSLPAEHLLRPLKKHNGIRLNVRTKFKYSSYTDEPNFIRAIHFQKVLLQMEIKLNPKFSSPFIDKNIPSLDFDHTYKIEKIFNYPFLGFQIKDNNGDHVIYSKDLFIY